MIKNKRQLIKNGKTASQRKVRKDIISILDEVTDNINPENIVKNNISLRGNNLVVENKQFDLESYENIYVVGAGKATYYMAKALEDILGKKIKGGLINIPEVLGKKLKQIEINIASHPIPNKGGLKGSRRILKILEKTGEHDLIIALISGGGSALMPMPAKGVKLADKIRISDLLISSEASIDEINIVRKHISETKGGRLAQIAYPATMVSFYISDVVGDKLDTIASGPTVADESTFDNAISVLKKYEIWGKTPKNIKKHLTKGSRGSVEESPKPNNKIFKNNKVFNYIIGSNKLALKVACDRARKLEYNCLMLTSYLEGEIHDVSKVLLSIAQEVKKYNNPVKKPAIILAGGETTLDLKGKGLGGRNAELVMASINGLKEGILIVSFATDGVDGRTPVPIAGAMADIATKDKSESKKLNVNKFLDENDSYGYFKKLDELIKTGYTGVNVGDIVMICIV
jgi:glycerate 2-kinase